MMRMKKRTMKKKWTYQKKQTIRTTTKKWTGLKKTSWMTMKKPIAPSGLSRWRMKC